MLLLESIWVLAALVGAFAFPSVGSRWFEKLERRFSAFARRRTLSVVAVGVLALALRAALLPILPIPEPIVSDEFGYLLQADTFTHARLTNPTHPMWIHFETFSVIHKPTYQCFAQPAQGLILAFGKVLFGHPFWGVWLSVGLMCAAICWMLQGWLPAEWALLGGVLAILRFGVFGYWANSYWGGAAGAIGGALVLGALPRIKRSQRGRDAVLMGLGLAILANSRPYEGFVLSLPVAAALFAWMFGKRRPSLAVSGRCVVAPLVLVLSLAAVATGYYFWRVTGSPLRMPYQVERETYGAAPYLLWETPRPLPTYHHADIQNVYVNGELPRYKLFRTALGFAYFSFEKAYVIWDFYIGPALTVPLLMLLLVLPYGFTIKDLSKPARFMSLTMLALLASFLTELYFWPHYASPGACLILFFILSAMRRLRRWQWRGANSGLFAVRALCMICLFTFIVRASAEYVHLPLRERRAPAWHQRGPNIPGRTDVLSQLNQSPGTQVVIVRYKPRRIPDREWVYNSADVDNSRIVWARDMGAAHNEELLEYFKDRRPWLLEPDETPPRLSQYLAVGSMDSKLEEETKVSADSQ
jgi:hypothetical protein